MKAFACFCWGLQIRGRGLSAGCHLPSQLPWFPWEARRCGKASRKGRESGIRPALGFGEGLSFSAPRHARLPPSAVCKQEMARLTALDGQGGVSAAVVTHSLTSRRINGKPEKRLHPPQPPPAQHKEASAHMELLVRCSFSDLAAFLSVGHLGPAMERIRTSVMSGPSLKGQRRPGGSLMQTHLT